MIQFEETEYNLIKTRAKAKIEEVKANHYKKVVYPKFKEFLNDNNR